MGQININVPIDQLKDRVCGCGNKVFVHACLLKEVPPIYSPSGNYETLSLHIAFACVRCGNVIPLQPEVKEDKPKEESKIIVGKG